MAISRRRAISISGATLAGLSLGVRPSDVAQAAQAPAAGAAPAAPAEWPNSLVEAPLRAGFPADLPLLPDGSAPEHNPSEAGAITPPLFWRTQGRVTPQLPTPQNMAIKVDTRGLGRLRGTLRFADLEKLPRVTATYLLQCGAANPRGIVTWSGVRFSDFADMLGLHPRVHYGRFVSVDGMYVDEDMTTLRHRQVMLAWMMNGQTLSADHGAPLRLIVPFRYGNRSIKAIAEISFGTPGLPAPPAPLPQPPAGGRGA
jgi:DMSO/TMAO reductase YedYZ molybdopterin-dependent catalytic subunit